MTSIGFKLKIVNSSDCEIITFTPRKTSQANPMGSTDLKGHEIIDSSYKLFLLFFWWLGTILWNHLYSLFRNLVNSEMGFKARYHIHTFLACAQWCSVISDQARARSSYVSHAQWECYHCATLTGVHSPGITHLMDSLVGVWLGAYTGSSYKLCILK